MSDGWIKLHRKVLESAVFMKPEYFQVWIYILLNVNHKEQKIIWNMEEKTIPQGAGIFSQKLISKKLKIAISTVNRILNTLKNGNQITIKSTNKYTEIQVVNWQDYQDDNKNGNLAETQPKPSGNPAETNKNVKKEKNVKNKGEELIFPFDSVRFLDAWEYWKDYKKTEHKFMYKSTSSEQQALLSLSKLSKGVEQTAIEVIQQSVSNGWKGFFELKNNNNGTEKAKSRLNNFLMHRNSRCN